MTAPRTVQALHLVVPRRVAGQIEVLVYPHARWRDPRSGRHLLTLPVTSLDHPTDAGIGPRLTHLLATDLDFAASASPEWEQVAAADLQAVSPAHGVLSRYRITAVAARLPLAAHGRTARHLKGEWLAPDVALAQAELSPTARATLERLAAAELVPEPPPPALGSGEERALTARLLAARDGDMNQFGAVVERLREAVIAQLHKYRLTGAYSAEDVFGDATVRALEKIDRFDPAKGTASQWFWTITYRTAVSRHRHERKRAELSDARAAGLEGREYDPHARLADGDELDAARARLAAALAALPPAVRRAWALLVDQDRPYKEVSAALKVPLGTLATWVRKVRTLAGGGRDRG